MSTPPNPVLPRRSYSPQTFPAASGPHSALSELGLVRRIERPLIFAGRTGTTKRKQIKP